MPEGFTPGPQHVICAKGKAAKEHQANQFLRHLVQSSLQEYSDASKLERSFLVSKIVKTIRQEGGFVREIDGKWYDVSDRNAREKIGQLYRDALHTQFKSSTKAKASVRRQRRRSTTNSSGSSFSNSSSSSVSSCSNSNMPIAPSSTPSFPTSTSFPITEVAFDLPQVTPHNSFSKTEVDLDFRSFEPLPLSKAMVMKFDHSMRSDDSSFDQAIDEMFDSQSDADDLFEPLPLF